MPGEIARAARPIRLSGSDTDVLRRAVRLTARRGRGGDLVDDFEAEFAALLERSYALALSEAELGLPMVLRALGLARGDEVILPAHGWRDIARFVACEGLVPVFVDVHAESGCLSPAALEAAIGARTRVVVATNANGHPADWDALRHVATRHRLRLVEDCGEAIGSRYRGRPVGSFGDVALFDFSPPAALACGTGGMAVTDDPRLADALRRQRDRLRAAMGPLEAAVGLLQLERLDERLAQRKFLESRYLAHFTAAGTLRPPPLAQDVDEVHWMLMLPRLAPHVSVAAGERVIARLWGAGIEASRYGTGLPRPCEPARLPVAADLFRRAIALPLHARLDEAQVQFIAGAALHACAGVVSGRSAPFDRRTMLRR